MRNDRFAAADARLIAVRLVSVLLLVGAVVAAVLAQRTTGWTQLGIMVAAVGVLVAVLATYNRRYR